MRGGLEIPITKHFVHENKLIIENEQVGREITQKKALEFKDEETEETEEEKQYNNFLFFFSIWVFHSRIFTNHRTAGEGERHFFNSSLPLQPASQTLRHWPGECCRELTSAHSWQPDSNWEPSVSERKSLTTKLSAHQSSENYADTKETQIYDKNKAVILMDQKTTKQ